MHLLRYQLAASEGHQHFEFISEGSKGRIVKQVTFEFIGDSIYNLAFGDVDTATQKIDDLVVSDNGDSEKVLATVVGAVYSFLAVHPDSWIYATGSTDSRTRLYQMNISRFFNVWKSTLDISGLVDGTWQPFERNQSFTAFLIRLKNA